MTARRQVVVGTDCSGMEPVHWALQNLGVPYRLAFASESNKIVRRFTRAVHGKPPRNYAHDMTKRPRLGRCHLYVAGFPCQPFSAEGLRGGLNEKAGRGRVIYSIMETIEQSRPHAFLLENVPGLLRFFRKDFNRLLGDLRGLLGKRYRVDYRLLNSKMFGLPQNRLRLYIIGLAKAHMRKAVAKGSKFRWPKPTADGLSERLAAQLQAITGPPRVSPATILAAERSGFAGLSYTARRNLAQAFNESRAAGHDPVRQTIIVDSQARKRKRGSWKCDVSRCLLAGHTGARGYWATNHHRPLTIEELLALQGFPSAEIIERLRGQSISHLALGHMIGNAMSLPVIRDLIWRLLRAVALV